MSIPTEMRAMVFQGRGQPLIEMMLPTPQPGPGHLLLRVRACAVCRTDLHIIDGELGEPKLPLIPGHQIVGDVMSLGEGVERFHVGERIGVPWLGHTDGTCRFCQRSMENLCENPEFTGYTIDGGFAEYCLAHQQFCFNLPIGYLDTQAAPLLCAGLIGYRAYRLAGDNFTSLGIYGFGAAAHIIAQVAIHQGKRVYAFTREGDQQAQDFALHLGARWAGAADDQPPEELDAALIFAPAGSLIVSALRASSRGGVVVCGGIHMSDIPAFPYHLLWEERVIRSVANLTRQDGEEFLALAPQIPVKTSVTIFPLAAANEALKLLRAGQLQGAAVLVVE
jgi:propanol-preferring alcohol dehydrogenase